MKKTPLILFAFFVSFGQMVAQTTGQSVINKKASSGYTLEAFTLGNSQIVGRTAAGTLSGFTLGSGLSLSGTTLTASGSGGTWGSVTGTLSNQTDLNTALGLKANSADLGALATLSAVSSATITDGTVVNADISASAAIALSKLATDPLARANHTGTQAWSTITTTPTTLNGYGITDGQPVAAVLTALSALSNNNGVLSNDGAGGLSYKATSQGGNGSADSAKLVSFMSSGGIKATALNQTFSSSTAGRRVEMSYHLTGDLPQLRFYASLGNETALRFAEPTGDYVVTIPARTGTLVTTGDFGAVTNTMLSGSIAASKLVATDITTVGTISTGVWNGTAITSAYLTGDDTAYDTTSWNGATSPPSKNAVRDKIEAMTGKVLQVVVVTPKTDTASGTNTTSAWSQAYTGSITVSSTTSRVICIVSTSLAATTGGYNAHARLTGGGNALAVGDAASSRLRVQSSAQVLSAAALASVTLVGSDTPGATGARTYALELATDSGGTWYLNRTPTDSNTSSYMRAATTMFLIEVEP